MAVAIGFVLNYAAYFAEIYRGGIESMPQGQYEAAKILGYSRGQTFFRIILPQVIKRILPSVTNETITLVKDTSLAFTIGVTDLSAAAGICRCFLLRVQLYRGVCDGAHREKAELLSLGGEP